MRTKRRNVPKSSKEREERSAHPIVAISGVSYSYPGQSALTDVSINAYKNELVGILGPNGSGKSTLFRILSSLQLPSEGRVEIDGRDILRFPNEGRRRIGVVFQSSGLDLKLTVFENLVYHGQFFGLAGSILTARVNHLLESFGLLGRRNDRVETLSGGLQRRVDLARGLLHQPPVLILDEPSSGLDPSARLDFWHFLTRAMQDGTMTVLVTTHLLDEADRCDRVVIMDGGSVVVSGSPEELKASLGGEIVVITASDPHRLAKRVRRDFHIDGTIIDRELHLETSDATRLIPKLAKAFSGAIEAVTIRKPGLQDVFLRRTGHRLAGQASNGGGTRR